MCRALVKLDDLYLSKNLDNDRVDFANLDYIVNSGLFYYHVDWVDMALKRLDSENGDKRYALYTCILRVLYSVESHLKTFSDKRRKGVIYRTCTVCNRSAVECALYRKERTMEIVEMLTGEPIRSESICFTHTSLVIFDTLFLSLQDYDFQSLYKTECVKELMTDLYVLLCPQ